MRRKITRVLAIVLAMATLLATGAMAAEPAPDVRVNGTLVTFPDAKPFIDENSRTMIPVRFATEQLGATVSWNGATQTATIAKNGITVDVTIGSPDLKVTKTGKAETVKMDTAAVLKDGRTYVPIRYVAEALGAYVDYSGYYNTVGIYNDVLTAKQIEKLQDYEYTTTSPGAYEQAKVQYSEATLELLYGEARGSYGTFANAREDLYRANKSAGKTVDQYYAGVVAGAIDSVAYSSKNLTIEFLTDSSCIYQADAPTDADVAVRGILKVTRKADMIKDFTAEDNAACDKMMSAMIGMLAGSVTIELPLNETVCWDVDAHMVKAADGTAYLRQMILLCDAYTE